MQKLVLLGATGSIGDQTLDIVQRYPDQFRVVGMSANQNIEKLTEQCEAFACGAFYSHTGADDDRQAGQLTDLITDEVDHVVVADHGLQSYEAVLKALALKKRVSIANKELLIAHGHDLMYLAREQQVTIIPIDSEHNALFQCLQGERSSDVRRLIITASGGPFRGKSWDELSEVTVEQVLDHPNWSMGAKTTVDSATLVNKAFEVIETHILFGVPYDQIEVRLHPESIVHAIIEFHDGSSKLLAYQPDMRFAIGYALFYPERAPQCLTGDDCYFEYDRDLHFETLASGTYPCFDLVVESARTNPEGLRSLVEADQQAVEAFMKGESKFTDIYTHLKQDLS